MWLVAFVRLLGALAECLQALKHNSQCCLLCTSLAWSDRNAPWLRPLQLRLPDFIHFSYCSLTVSTSACCSLIVSASAAAPQVHLLAITHTQYIVLGIISTKIVHHYCIPSPQTSRFCYGHTQTFKILMYWCMHAFMGVCKMQRCSFLFVFLIEGVSEYALIFFPLQWRVWVQLITMTWL